MRKGRRLDTFPILTPAARRATSAANSQATPLAALQAPGSAQSQHTSPGFTRLSKITMPGYQAQELVRKCHFFFSPKSPPQQSVTAAMGFSTQGRRLRCVKAAFWEMGDAHKSRAMRVQVPHSRTKRVNWEQKVIREFLTPGEHPRVVQAGGLKPIKGLLGSREGLAAGGKARSRGAEEQVSVRVLRRSVPLLLVVTWPG